MYDGSHCGASNKGEVAVPQSVAGLANHMCIPVSGSYCKCNITTIPYPLNVTYFLIPHSFISGFGGDKGQAIMMDCLENGDVIMNAFNANDCTGNDNQHNSLEKSSSHYLKTQETTNFDHFFPKRCSSNPLPVSLPHATSQFRCTHRFRGSCCCGHLLRLLLLP